MNNPLMDKRIRNELLNTLAMDRVVNLHFDGSGLGGEGLEHLVAGIKGEIGQDYHIDMDIAPLFNAGNDMVRSFLDKANRDLFEQGSSFWIHEADSIAHLLTQVDNDLDRPAVFLLYPFKDETNEREKMILTGIRKFIMMRQSMLLGILIISTKAVFHWDLAPYSNLEKTYVTFVKQTINKDKSGKGFHG